jgi:hypothetical protein
LVIASAKKISADVGSYTINGTASSLRHAWKVAAGSASYSLTGSAATLRRGLTTPASAGSYAIGGQAASLALLRRIIAQSEIYSLTGTDAALTKSTLIDLTLSAGIGEYLVTGEAISIVYTSRPGIYNPLGRLKMYVGSMGSVSNREDWIVNISLLDDDEEAFNLNGCEVVVYVCRRGCPDSPVLSAAIGNGIVLYDSYTLQWHFNEDQMATLCPQQYDVFCRVERDEITTQLLAANIAIVEGGPKS